MASSYKQKDNGLLQNNKIDIAKLYCSVALKRVIWVFRSARLSQMTDTFFFIIDLHSFTVHKINDMETKKIKKNAAPTRKKPCQYSLSASLKQPPKTMELDKTVRGQCGSLMLLQTMTNKWYKKLLKASTLSFWF